MYSVIIHENSQLSYTTTNSFFAQSTRWEILCDCSALVVVLLFDAYANCLQVIWPLLEDTIARFDSGGMKPYWLTPARDKLSALGLLEENALWSAMSSQLFLFCWKNQIEAVRKTEILSGSEWWLVQDYW